ncbi:MAG: hypothetical protein WC942_04015 [Clostridia bacterium]|jgi:hypothetical protein
MEPILLFKVQKKDRKSKKMVGVYYIPQQGFGMDGFKSDGSMLKIARHLANSPEYISFEACEINPINIRDSDAICNELRKWIIK